MIEITAKQLFDIYRHLPDYEQYVKDGYPPRIRVAFQPTVFYSATSFDGGNIPIPKPVEVEFEVDNSCYPYEWKPRTDLIIKA